MFDGIGANPAYTRTTPAYSPQQNDPRADAAREQRAQAQQAEARTQGQPAHAASRGEQAEAAVQQTPFSTVAAQPMNAPSTLQAAQMGPSAQPGAVNAPMAQTTMTGAMNPVTASQAVGAASTGSLGETVQPNGMVDATDPANRGSHVDTEI
ncbi:hypothetical protein [Thioalkalivibrio sp.]|uniref:hypothetical protein n=1 Tax=Thioalkalivibrio sp. TaxID=2093813 RepID=UPI003563CAD0